MFSTEDRLLLLPRLHRLQRASTPSTPKAPPPSSSSSSLAPTSSTAPLHEPVLAIRERDDESSADSDGTRLYEDADLEGLCGSFEDWPPQWSFLAQSWNTSQGLIDVDALQTTTGGPIELLDGVSKCSSPVDPRHEAFYVDEYDGIDASTAVTSDGDEFMVDVDWPLSR